jgi:hypothetical protein
MSAPQFTPLTNLSLDTFQNQVKVIVGPSKAEVFISIDLLTRHSGYFKGACNEQWNSGRTKTVILDHEEPEVFNVFLNWLYTGSIQSSVGFVELQELDRRGGNNFDKAVLARYENKERAALFNSALEHQWIKLAKCFVLSRFLIAPVFHNVVTDMMVLNHRRLRNLGLKKFLEHDEIRYLYTNTDKGYAFGKIVLDNHISFLGISQGFPMEPCFQEFLEEVALHTLSDLHDTSQRARPSNGATCSLFGSISSGGSMADHQAIDFCQYHSHPGKPDCGKK